MTAISIFRFFSKISLLLPLRQLCGPTELNSLSELNIFHLLKLILKRPESRYHKVKGACVIPSHWRRAPYLPPHVIDVWAWNSGKYLYKKILWVPVLLTLDHLLSWLIVWCLSFSTRLCLLESKILSFLFQCSPSPQRSLLIMSVTNMLNEWINPGM